MIFVVNLLGERMGNEMTLSGAQDWKQRIEELLRNQMPYVFMRPDPGTGASVRGSLLEEEFKIALGYVLEFVEMEQKRCFMEGYAGGVVDSIADQGITQFQFDKDISRIGAERKWEEFNNG